MAEKKKCPKCGSGNCYVLVGGKVVCRNCGYDERTAGKNKEAKNMKSNTENALSPIVGTLLMIAIVIILAAIIGAFVFGVAGEQKPGHTAGFSADRVDGAAIELTYMSSTGTANDIRSIEVHVGSDIYTYNSPTVGQKWKYTGHPPQTRMYVVATFDVDGSQYPILDQTL